MKWLSTLLLCIPSLVFSQEKLTRPWRLMLQDYTISHTEFEEAFRSQTAELSPAQIKEYKKYLFRANLHSDFQDASGRFVGKQHMQRLVKERSLSNNARGLVSSWTALEPESDLLVKCCLWDGCGIPEIPADEVMNVSNRLLEVAMHPLAPHIMWLTTPSGGCWKSTDAGDSWNEMSETWPNGGCRKIVLHPTDTNTVYIATGGDDGMFSAYGVQKSVDGGLSWQLLHGDRTDINQIYQMQMDPSNTEKLYMATDRGFFVSSDAGESWLERSPVVGQGYQDFILVPQGDQTQVQLLLQSRTNLVQLYHSNNGGENFEHIMLPYENTPSSDDDFIDGRIAYSPADPNIVYVVGWPAANGSVSYNFEEEHHHLYKSVDGGLTFERLPDFPDLFSRIGSTWGTYQFEVNPLDANDIAFGALCTAFSKDGGQSWQEFTWHQVDKQFFTWHPTTNELYCVDDGGLVKLTKSNQIVDISDPPLIQYYDLTHAPDLSYFGGGTQDAGTMVVKDGIRYRVGGGDGMTMLVDPIDPNVAIVSSQNGRFKKTRIDDPTQGRYVLGDWMDNDQRGTWVSQIVMHPWNHNKLYAAIRNFFYSEDNGDSWTRLTANEDIGYAPDFLRISESVPNRLVVGSVFGDLHRSDDGGRSWSSLGQPFHRIRDIELHHLDSNLMWAAAQLVNGGEIGVFESRDGGVSWSSISLNLANTVIRDLEVDKNTNEGIYALTLALTQVYHYHKNCDEWTNHSVGLPNTSSQSGALDIVYQTGKIRVGTRGRGAWEGPLLEVNEALTLPVPQQPQITLEQCLGDIEIVALGEESTDSYHWYLDDVFVTSTTANRYQPSENGAWSVRAKNGIQYSYASEQVDLMVDAAKIINGPSMICPGQIVRFSLIGLEDAENITWYVPGVEEGCVAGSSIYLPVRESGTLSVIVNSSCGSKTFYKELMIGECQGSIGLDFDGVDDHVLIEGFDWTAVQSFTIETMVKAHSLPTDRHVAFAEFGADWNDHVALELLSTGSLRGSLTRWNFDTERMEGDELISTETININQWHHVACTYDHTTQTFILYLDGTELMRVDGTLLTPADIRFSEAHLGTSFHWETQPHFDGEMEHFRFWNTARTAGEISTSGSCFDPDSSNDLLLEYTFQGGSPAGSNQGTAKIYNQAGFQLNGTPSGFAFAGTGSNFISTDLEQEQCLDILPSCPAVVNDLSTSLEDLPTYSFVVYPNPTADQLFISQRGQSVASYQLRMFDLMGRELMMLEQPSRIDVSTLVTGIYYLDITVNADRRRYQQKIVVSR